MALAGSGGSGGASANAIKAGEAFFEITGKDEQFKQLINRNVDRIKKFGQTVRNIGLGVAGAGGAVLAPLTGLFKTSLDRADKFDEMSQILETSAESLSKVAYAAEFASLSLEDVQGLTTKLNLATVAASEGAKEQADAFDKLGISAEDFSQLPLEEKYAAIAESLESLESPLQRTQFLSSLFGKRFAEVLPFLGEGSDKLRELFKEAERVGAVINSDDAKQAADINDNLARAWTSLKSTAYEVGIAIVGANASIKDGTNTIIDNFRMIREWIKENRAVVLTVAAIAAGVVAGGTALAVFGFAISGIVAGIVALKGILIAVVTTALSPFVIKIALISAAIGGLIYLFTEFTETGQQLKASFIETFTNIASIFKESYGGIVAALQKGDLALAGKIALKGLEAAWAEGMHLLTLGWVKFKGTFVDVFHDAVAGIRLIWNDLFTWLMDKSIWVITKILENIGYVSDRLGITDDLEQLAKDSARIAREQNKQDRARKEEDILRQRDEQQRDNERFRMNQQDEADRRRQRLKEELEDLVRQAKERPPEKPPNAAEKKKDLDRKKEIDRLSDSVRGLFTSADYRGALGIGKANDFAKKTLAVNEKQLGVLNRIEGKLDVNRFE